MRTKASHSQLGDISRVLPENYGRLLAIQSARALLGHLCPLAAQRILHIGNSHLKLMNFLNYNELYHLYEAREDEELFNQLPEDGLAVLGNYEALPFADETFDLLIAPHVLEVSSKPHDLLREFTRVLNYEGVMLLIGINPYSLLGGHLYLRSEKKKALPGMLSLSRIKDLLRVLALDPLASQMISYRPVCKQRNTIAKCAWLDKTGNRWWPMGANLYLILVQKRKLQPLMIKPNWKKTKMSRKLIAAYD